MDLSCCLVFNSNPKSLFGTSWRADLPGTGSVPLFLWGGLISQFRKLALLAIEFLIDGLSDGVISPPPDPIFPMRRQLSSSSGTLSGGVSSLCCQDSVVFDACLASEMCTRVPRCSCQPPRRARESSGRTFLVNGAFRKGSRVAVSIFEGIITGRERGSVGLCAERGPRGDGGPSVTGVAGSLPTRLCNPRPRVLLPRVL